MLILQLLLPGLILVAWSSNRLPAQKIEVEERISRPEFPAAALQYVDLEFPVKKRLKFYREFSKDSLTFEAKFIADRHQYSVEFFPDGQLIDIEKKIKFKAIPKVTRQTILEHWKQDFKKVRVVKCQEQKSPRGIRYEIEVRGKGEKQTAFYQYLFEANGNFVERDKIELRSSDMTLY